MLLRDETAGAPEEERDREASAFLFGGVELAIGPQTLAACADWADAVAFLGMGGGGEVRERVSGPRLN